ncbi:hypothetical protein Glove_309g156 [Diversispora epigaea]|uniref:Uncharacterized protein n=1 Tax=Diversispora epigaea TaxID=1348612 RepID=A0A397HSU0_9GLOM|nr:hypothetical protein Glove_309g156 [Diversispora epigaea]
MKLIDQCENPENKKKLRSILMEIDFIHLHFNESEGELLEIAKELLRPYRNKYMRALTIFVPKQVPEASGSSSVKRKRNSGGDVGNKRARRK